MLYWLVKAGNAEWRDAVFTAALRKHLAESGYRKREIEDICASPLGRRIAGAAMKYDCRTRVAP